MFLGTFRGLHFRESVLRFPLLPSSWLWECVASLELWSCAFHRAVCTTELNDAPPILAQVFEAMGEFITEDSFYKHAMPCMEKIAKALRARHPTTPLLVFPRGATYSLVSLQRAGYDIVTMDTKTDRVAARKALVDDAAKSPPPTLSGRPSGLQVGGPAENSTPAGEAKSAFASESGSGF